MLLFAMIRSVVKSVKVPVVEVAELTNRSYRFRHRSSGDKSAGYVCSPALDGSVLIVAVRECIVAPGSVSADRKLLMVGGPSVLCCCLGAEWPNLPRVCAGSGGFPSCLHLFY